MAGRWATAWRSWGCARSTRSRTRSSVENRPPTPLSAWNIERERADKEKPSRRRVRNSVGSQSIAQALARSVLEEEDRPRRRDLSAQGAGGELATGRRREE